MRSGVDLVLWMAIAGGVLFTLLSVAAWVRGRRVAGLLLAAVAGLDFAFAVGLLNR